MGYRKQAKSMEQDGYVNSKGSTNRVSSLSILYEEAFFYEDIFTSIMEQSVSRLD